jgi:hypothetical protein
MSRPVLALLVLAAVVVALLLTWMVLGGRGSTGSAETAVAEHDVEPFRRIDVSGGAEVVLQPGTQEHVSIEAPARGMRVAAEVDGDTLIVVARDRRRWWSSIFGPSRGSRAPRITVTYRTLDAVTLSGAVKLQASRLETPELRLEANGGSTLRVDGLKTKVLHVDGSGALKAEIAGEATDQHVTISGAGQYDGSRLASTHASVDVSGVGKVVVRVEQSLDASISGAGTIEYVGNPKVRENVSGVGRVKRREAAERTPAHFHVASWLVGGAAPGCLLL